METTPAAQPVAYAHGSIVDRTYPVTAARIYEREIEVGGDNGWGKTVVAIDFYTGFAGCPARYYITVTDGRQETKYVSNATGLA